MPDFKPYPCLFPTRILQRTNAEGKSRPAGLPTRRGSLSKVSIPGKPCWQKNWATTSKRTSASRIAAYLAV